MTEAPKRRNLFAVTAPTPDPVPQEAIAEIAARNGFAAMPAASPTAEASSRRRRQPTGRDHQFNVRLRQDTLASIYAEANGRNIPVAQVIEEAIDALRQSQRRS